MTVSDGPFDYERDEERSARETSPYWPDDPDRPDPSEYEDIPDPVWDAKMIVEQALEDIKSDMIAIDDLTGTWAEIKDEYVRVFVTERHENDALKGLLILLLAVLGGLMFWIWFGAAILRWLR